MLVSCSLFRGKMRKFIAIHLFLLLVTTSCSSGDHHYENPNLLDVKVDFNVDLSLPQYNPLQFPMQPVYVKNAGNGGVIIIKTGADSYVAFDAHDPNNPRDCGILEVDGLEGVSQCDDYNTYNLVTGSPVESKSKGENLEFGLKPYQVITLGGGRLRVKN